MNSGSNNKQSGSQPPNLSHVQDTNRKVWKQYIVLILIRGSSSHNTSKSKQLNPQATSHLQSNSHLKNASRLRLNKRQRGHSPMTVHLTSLKIAA